MAFRITGLAAQPFQPLFGLSDQELAPRGVSRVIASGKPGFPDRIELRDAEPGDSLLLLNYTHQPAQTAYRACHAIFVREGALRTYDRVDEVPVALYGRVLALRAFDAQHMMLDAELTEAAALGAAIAQLFARREVSYLQVHYAKRGCYAARVEGA